MKKNNTTLIVITFAVLGILIGLFFYYKPVIMQKFTSNPKFEVQKEAEDLVKKVSKFILLPEGELPTIATVSDFEKLKDQPFFEKSQNGDKVLIYPQAKKAYLYRPSTDRLIDVTIVNVNSTAASPKPQEIRVVLRNGTTSAGLTNKLEPIIMKALSNSLVVKKENAAKNDYQSTLVVVLSESATQAASTLADHLKATITTLPSEEIKPSDADILVIIGSDKI